MSRETVTSALEVVGGVSIIAGAAMLSVPVALIVGGVLSIVFGVRGAR